MSLKKFFIFLMLMLFSLKAFSENKKIGVILPNYNETFYNNLKTSLENKSKSYGFDIINLNSEDNISKEVSNVENLIMNNVDVIVVRPIDVEKSSNALKAANLNKIPVILLELKVENENYNSIIKFNYDNIGNQIGEYLIEALPENKNKIAKLKFFDDENINKKIDNDIKKITAGKIEIISDKKIRYDDNKGINSIKDIIINHPQIDAILAYNESLASSTLKVLKAAGRSDIKVISIGSNDQIERAYRNKEISAIFIKNYNEFSNKILELSHKILNKEEYDKEINIDINLFK